MNAPRQKFPLIVHTYFWITFSLLGLSPILFLYVLSDRMAVMPRLWASSFVWPLLVAIFFWYGSFRCSSKKAPFRDGLLWITWSMLTGWMNMSFLTVTPTLLTAFFGSILIATYGDLQRRPEYAPAKWSQIVAFFYRNRMRR